MPHGLVPVVEEHRPCISYMLHLAMAGTQTGYSQVCRHPEAISLGCGRFCSTTWHVPEGEFLSEGY